MSPRARVFLSARGLLPPIQRINPTIAPTKALKEGAFPLSMVLFGLPLFGGGFDGIALTTVARKWQAICQSSTNDLRWSDTNFSSPGRHALIEGAEASVASIASSTALSIRPKFSIRASNSG
jgi:hypothetical protein